MIRIVLSNNFCIQKSLSKVLVLRSFITAMSLSLYNLSVSRIFSEESLSKIKSNQVGQNRRKLQSQIYIHVTFPYTQKLITSYFEYSIQSNMSSNIFLITATSTNTNNIPFSTRKNSRNVASYFTVGVNSLESQWQS